MTDLNADNFKLPPMEINYTPPQRFSVGIMIELMDELLDVWDAADSEKIGNFCFCLISAAHNRMKSKEKA